MLHLAASSGNCKMIYGLLKKGIRILDKDANGITAVHLAAKNGHEETLDFLLSQLDESQVRDLLKIYPHPLHLAAKNNYLNCCKIIVKYHKVSEYELPIFMFNYMFFCTLVL